MCDRHLKFPKFGQCSVHSLDGRMLTDENNFVGFPKKEACLKNPVNVTYFQTIYVAASSLNVKRLFDSELKKK